MGEGSKAEVEEKVWVVEVVVGEVEEKVVEAEDGAEEVGEEEITERWTNPGSLLVSGKRSSRPRFKPFLQS